MANEKNWIVNTWNHEVNDWQEAARFETYDEAVDWAEKTYGLHGDYTFENALETRRRLPGGDRTLRPQVVPHQVRVHRGRHRNDKLPI